MTKLYVGNLPYSIANQDLAQLFESFGKVASAQVIMDKISGRSKGFGFVEMENDEEAQKAIQDLNGYEMDGRKLSVSIARPREERPSYQSGGFKRDYDNRGGGFDRNRRPRR